MDQIQWRPDEQAVAMMQQMGLSHVVREVVVQAEIDTRTPNGARQKPIDAELVDDYLCAMRAGDVFPHIVLAAIDGKKKLQVIGGNHRLQAAVKIGAASAPAIVVECGAFEAATLAKRLNTVNGKRESREVRIAQAIDLVQQHGQSVDVAARTAGISSNVVTAALRTDKVRQRAMELGLPCSNKLRNTDGVSIGELVNDGDVFPALYEFAISPNCSHDRLAALCRSVRKAGTLAERKALIEKATQECQDTTGPKARMFPVAAQIKRAVNLLSNQTRNKPTLLALQLTREDAAMLLSEVQTVAHTLQAAIGRS